MGNCAPKVKKKTPYVYTPSPPSIKTPVPELSELEIIPYHEDRSLCDMLRYHTFEDKDEKRFIYLKRLGDVYAMDISSISIAMMSCMKYKRDNPNEYSSSSSLSEYLIIIYILSYVQGFSRNYRDNPPSYKHVKYFVEIMRMKKKPIESLIPSAPPKYVEPPPPYNDTTR
jgi:hypothetical protein